MSWAVRNSLNSVRGARSNFRWRRAIPGLYVGGQWWLSSRFVNSHTKWVYTMISDKLSGLRSPISWPSVAFKFEVYKFPAIGADFQLVDSLYTMAGTISMRNPSLAMDSPYEKARKPIASSIIVSRWLSSMNNKYWMSLLWASWLLRARLSTVVSYQNMLTNSQAIVFTLISVRSDNLLCYWLGMSIIFSLANQN